MPDILDNGWWTGAPQEQPQKKDSSLLDGGWWGGQQTISTPPPHSGPWPNEYEFGPMTPPPAVSAPIAPVTRFAPGEMDTLTQMGETRLPGRPQHADPLAALWQADPRFSVDYGPDTGSGMGGPDSRTPTPFAMSGLGEQRFSGKPAPPVSPTQMGAPASAFGDQRSPIEQMARDFLYSNESDQGQWADRIQAMPPAEQSVFLSAVSALRETLAPPRDGKPGVVSEALRRGMAQVGELPGRIAGALGNRTGETFAQAQKLRREFDPLTTESFWGDAGLAIAEQIPSLLAGAGAQKTLAVTPKAASWIGDNLGKLRGALLYWFGQIGSQRYVEFRDDGLDPDSARVAAAATGAVESAIEMFLSPLEQLAPTASKSIRQGFKKFAFDYMKELAEEPAQDFTAQAIEKMTALIDDQPEIVGKVGEKTLQTIKTLPEVAAVMLGMVGIPSAISNIASRRSQPPAEAPPPRSTVRASAPTTAHEILAEPARPGTQTGVSEPTATPSPEIAPERIQFENTPASKAMLLTPDGAAAFAAQFPTVAKRIAASGKIRGNDRRASVLSQPWNTDEITQLATLLKEGGHAKNTTGNVTAPLPVNIDSGAENAVLDGGNVTGRDHLRDRAQAIDIPEPPPAQRPAEGVQPEPQTEIPHEETQEEGQGRQRLLNEPQGPGPPPDVMNPAAASAIPPDDLTGIKNAQTDRDRERLGLPPRETPTVEGWEESNAKAAEIERREPGAALRLFEELKKNPRAPKDAAEEGLLLRYKRRVENDINAALVRRDDAQKAGDDAALAQADQDIAAAEARDAELVQIAEATGTVAGRAFNFRKAMMAKDFSLPKMLAQERARRGVETLTPEQAAEVKDLHEKLAAAEKRAAEAESKATAEEIQSAVDAAIAEHVKKAEKERESRPKSGSKRKADAAKEARDALAEFTKLATGKLFANPLDPELLVSAVKVVKAYAKFGIASFREFMERVTKDMGERAERARDIFQAAWESENPHPLEGVDTDNPKELTLAAQDLMRYFIREHGITEREPMVDAVHEELKPLLPKLTRDDVYAILSGKGQFAMPNPAEVEVIRRRIRRQALLVSQIKDLEAGQLPPRTGPQREEMDDESRRLAKIRDNLKKIVNPPESSARLKSALATRKRYYENRIADLKREIETKQRMVKDRRIPPTDPELESLIAESKRLESERDNVLGKRTPTNEELDQRLVRSLERRAAEYDRRADAGDFEPKKRRERPQTKATIDARTAFEKAKLDWQRRGEKQRWERKSKIEKIGLTALDALRLPFAFMTSLDLSAVGRQGAWAGLGNPDLAARSFASMMRSVRSDERALGEQARIDMRENAKNGIYKRSKLRFTDPNGPPEKQEEMFRGRLAKIIPGIAASNRAFVAYLNRLRAEMFDAMLASLGSNATDAELRIIANYVNVATGIGNLGHFKSAAGELATIFFAPKWVSSRFELLFGQPFVHEFGKGTWRVRRLIAKEYAKSLTGLGIVYGSAAAILSAVMGAPKGATGGPDDEKTWEIGLDPRSSDFGKLRIGRTRIDFLGGLSQASTLVGRLATGTVKPVSGKARPVEFRDLADFLRQKVAPIPGALMDLRFGSAYPEPDLQRDIRKALGDTSNMGRKDKQPWYSTLSELVVPLSFGDIYSSMVSDAKIPRKAAQILLSIFGIGVKTYDDRKRKAG